MLTIVKAYYITWDFMHMRDEPKLLRRVVVWTFNFLVCYFIFASGNEMILKDGSILTVSQSKLVGAGLYLFYFLSVIAAGTMLYFGVKKSLNK